MRHHEDIARRHPIAFFLIIMLLGPYILAAILLYVIFYVIAVVLDALVGPS